MKEKSEFCNTLREVGEALASGEKEVVEIPKAWIEYNVTNGKSITASYIRTIIGRVQAVKAIGAVSVKSRESDDGAKHFVISINRNPKRKMITSDELPELEASWRAKFIKHLLSTQPRITDLQGEQLNGAAIALERFAAMIEKMGEVNE